MVSEETHRDDDLKNNHLDQDPSIRLPDLNLSRNFGLT